MAKQRIVNTKFWDDSYIVGLSPLEKLLFLYLLTNPLTNISGVYELPLRRVAFDVGVPVETVDSILGKFETDGKVMRWENWVGIKNFIKHQSQSPKIRQGILSELEKAPRILLDTLSIPYQGLSHLNSNSNLKSNPNSNPNGLPPREFSPRQGELEKWKRELVRRWQP